MSEAADENDVVETPAAKADATKPPVKPQTHTGEHPPDPRPVERRTSSRNAIMEGLKAMGVGGDADKDDEAYDDDDAPPKNPPAAPPANPPIEAAPATPPVLKQEDRPSWNDIMERDHSTREKARELADKEKSLAHVAEAANLLRDNPAAFAQKFGGENFASRYVSYVQNNGQPPPEERIGGVEQRLDAFMRRIEEDREREREDAYVATHVGHLTGAEDAALLKGWYEPDEYREVARGMTRNARQQSGKQLTPTEAASTLTGELKLRLERLSKLPAGQQYLRTLLGSESPKPQRPQKPATPSSGAKTLSSDLASQGTPPPAQRLRRREERGSIIADALKAVSSGD